MLDFTLAEFTDILNKKYDKGDFHAEKMYQQVFRQGNSDYYNVEGFEKAQKFLKALGDDFQISPMELVTSIKEGDTTKLILRTTDALEIESVVIPMSHYNTLCVSSQIGCKMACQFCETGQMGLLRNLSVAEIVGQVFVARFLLGFEIRNIVFMGMGEPFDNFDFVMKAIEILTEPKGLSFAKSNITVSTVGRVDGINKLAKKNWKRLNLAVSLNAPNDEIRSQIMPVNIKTNMAELKSVLMAYPKRKSGLILIEYVLIKNVNDQKEHAEQLAEYLKGLRNRLNLIPYNPRNDSPFEAPTQDECQQFYEWLKELNVFVCFRATKGQKVMAACGQLGNRELRAKRAKEKLKEKAK